MSAPRPQLRRFHCRAAPQYFVLCNNIALLTFSATATAPITLYLKLPHTALPPSILSQTSAGRPIYVHSFLSKGSSNWFLMAELKRSAVLTQNKRFFVALELKTQIYFQSSRAQKTAIAWMCDQGKHSSTRQTPPTSLLPFPSPSPSPVPIPIRFPFPFLVLLPFPPPPSSLAPSFSSTSRRAP